MAFETPLAQYSFLAGRILFGGILAFMGLNHFMKTDSLTEYAEYKGVPAPRMAVVFAGLLLVLGGLSVAFGAYVWLGTLSLLLFFIVATFQMHDFWNFDDPEQKQQQRTNFLKNLVILGGTLALFALSSTAWPYALNWAL